MKAPVETVRVSQKGKETLIRLKRKTGIEHWNVLCRWALMTSLANPQPPPKALVAEESNIEIKWPVFGGPNADLYSAILYIRATKDLEKSAGSEMADYFRAHLERGIASLQNRRDLTDLVSGAAVIL